MGSRRGVGEPKTVNRKLAFPLQLHFFVQRVPAEKLVVFHLLDFFLLHALIARSEISGRRFAFLAGFGAFQTNEFSGHGLIKVSPPAWQPAGPSATVNYPAPTRPFTVAVAEKMHLTSCCQP